MNAIACIKVKRCYLENNCMHFKRIEHFAKIPWGLSGGLSFQVASVQFLIKERLRFKQDLNMDHFLSQLFIKLFLNTQRSTGLLFLWLWRVWNSHSEYFLCFFTRINLRIRRDTVKCFSFYLFLFIQTLILQLDFSIGKIIIIIKNTTCKLQDNQSTSLEIMLSLWIIYNFVFTRRCRNMEVVGKLISMGHHA